MARLVKVDFTGVEAGSNFSRVPEGDYAFKINKVDLKKGDKGNYLLFHLKVTKGNPKAIGKMVPHNCSLTKQSLWNFRNLIEACGKPVASKALNIDLDKMVGWELAGTVVDDEYEGKKKSVVSGFFPVGDLQSVTNTEGKETDSVTEGEEAETEESGSDEEVEELFE